MTEQSKADRGRRQYSTKLLDAQSWFMIGGSLVRALEKLQPVVDEWCEALKKDPVVPVSTIDDGSVPIYMMIAGLAIENFCKGFLVTQLTVAEIEAIIDSARLPRPLSSHNLPRLVDLLGMPMSFGERCRLGAVWKAVVWRARYPIPTSWEGLQPTLESTSDPQRIREFLDKLRVFVAVNPRA